MTIIDLAGRLGAVLLVGSISMAKMLTEQGPTVEIAEDGAVDTARQCDVYITGSATSTRPDPLRYRWLEGATELSAWSEVRADGTAPLELCGLPAGRHALTLEVTDGKRTTSDTMTATIVAAPALVARGGDASDAP